MKIGFYSPYVPGHFGGGEKYFFDAATTYAAKHQVFIALPSTAGAVDPAAITTAYQKFLGRDLGRIKFVPSPLGAGATPLAKWRFTRNFDVFYFVTDGSLPVTGAPWNILHIQIPLLRGRLKLGEKLKRTRFQIIQTNSQFTKQVVEKSWGLKVNLVCPPGVEVEKFKSSPTPKESLILNVGRFFANLHSKRQDILVECWRQLLAREKSLTRGWRLVLLGSVEDEEYLTKVKHLAAGLPVEFVTAATRQQVLNYFRRAAIYWHATGYGADEKTQPEKMEHFGISTVEAMASGCAPLVLGRGGQREVLGPTLAPWAWQTKVQCLALTTKLLADAGLRQQVQAQAVAQAQKFSLSQFQQKHWEMLPR